MDQFHQHFRAAFAWLLTTRRLEEKRVATDKALAYWLDRATRFNNNQPIAAAPFCASAIACGDIYIYSNFSNLPFDVSLGLGDGYRSGSVDRTAGWRRVLNGELLMPVAPPKRNNPAYISFR